jgi:UTP-glucose-1-phosphate uridylyltransferase
MKPTLLILAAGMGTRYGGLKQIDPVGPNGEVIIDYAIYDAVNAGFGKLVFVIRHCFEDAFKQKIGSKFDERIETAYAYQEVDSCLDDFQPPKDRSKPWGTGHAILVARDLIDEPFTVINADDHYGPGSFKKITEFLIRKNLSSDDYAMVGYTLKDTLSEYGSVSRGVCQCDENMFLKSIIERKKVEKTSAGARYFDEDGSEYFLTGDEIVSRNMWVFQPSIFDHLKIKFRRFLEELNDKKRSEFFIPTVVDELIREKTVKVKVLPADDMTFGVTYRSDAPIAKRSIAKLIEQGLYPDNLWEQS